MVIYFSGTGNTREVANELARRLDDSHVVELRGATLLGEAPRIAVEEGERVVWCIPVYSWGVPPVVVNWMKKMTFEGVPSAHYLVATCGDDAGRLAAQWRRLCRRKWGPETALPGVYTVQMPNTYVFMKGFDVDAADVEKAKLEAMPKRVGEIVRRILSGENGDDVVAGSWAWLKTAVVYPWFVRFCMSPKPFHATEACIGCGACTRVCPMENIVLADDHRPRWGENCALCSGCYHVCPVHAVAYGRTCRSKGQKAIL